MGLAHCRPSLFRPKIPVGAYCVACDKRHDNVAFPRKPAADTGDEQETNCSHIPRPSTSHKIPGSGNEDTQCRPSIHSASADKDSRLLKTLASSGSDLSPIHQAFWEYLSVSDIVQLRKTCPAFHAHTIDIDCVLRRFFPEPGSLRATLAKGNALITGSLIRYMLRTGNVPDVQSMTFVVDKGYEKDLQDFFLYQQYDLYETLQSGDQTAYRNSNGFTITLLCTEEPPIRHILNFEMSADMNFATYNNVYSLWPEPTFWKKISYRFYSLDKETHLNDTAATALQNEGIKIREISQFDWTEIKLKIFRSQEMSEFKENITRLRQVGDKYTWKVPLDTDRINESSISDRVIQSTSFQFRQGHQEHDELILRPLCTIRHPLLEYSYVVVLFHKNRSEEYCKLIGEIWNEYRLRDRTIWSKFRERKGSPDWLEIYYQLHCNGHTWDGFSNNSRQPALKKLPGEAWKDDDFVSTIEKLHGLAPTHEPE